MNQAHYHLLLNHLPLLIPFFGLLILVGGFLFRSAIVKRTAFLLFIFGAIVTIPAYLTGEEAEEVVENIHGIDEKYIKPHEEAAEIFAISSYVLGVISLLGFWANYKQKSFANILALVIIIVVIIVLFYAQQTGKTGGEIRHTEIRAIKIKI